jgi:hypothetical protein
MKRRMTPVASRRTGKGLIPSFGERETYSDDEIDVSLIRWMLSLTPAERLETLQNHVRGIMRLRGENDLKA